MKLLSVLVLILVLSVSSILSVLQKYAPNVYDAATTVLEAKVTSFIKGEDVENFDSRRARGEQFEKACVELHKTLPDEIFGAGLQHISLRPAILDANNKVCHIENMFYVMYVIYGVVGFSLFLSFFVVMPINIWISELELGDKCFLLTLIGIIAVSSTALISFYLIQIFGIISFCVGYFRAKKHYRA